MNCQTNREGLEMEKRIREICREWKSGFWRIDGFGEDMISLVLKGRGKVKNVSLYIGKQEISSILTIGGSEGYANIGQMVDIYLPER